MVSPISLLLLVLYRNHQPFQLPIPRINERTLKTSSGIGLSSVLLERCPPFDMWLLARAWKWGVKRFRLLVVRHSFNAYADTSSIRFRGSRKWSGHHKGCSFPHCRKNLWGWSSRIWTCTTFFICDRYADGSLWTLLLICG